MARTRMHTQFDFGDATATLSGARAPEPPYTPACQTGGGPACILAEVRQTRVIKGETTIFAYSEFEHEYIYGRGPYEARLSGCCRPGAQTSKRQGLINNPGGAFKIASTVMLSDTDITWAESPVFLQTPVVAVPLSRETTLQIQATHPTRTVHIYLSIYIYVCVCVSVYIRIYIYVCTCIMYTYTHMYIQATHPTRTVRLRAGTIADFGADLTTAVPVDKRGMPAGVVVDTDTGVLAIPQLFEPQLYAVHLVAELGDGVAAAVDFYLSVVSGAGSAGGVNDPPVLTPVCISIDRSID